MTLHTRETVMVLMDVTCDGCGLENLGTDLDGYFLTDCDSDQLAEILEAQQWETSDDQLVHFCPGCVARFVCIVAALGGAE